MARVTLTQYLMDQQRRPGGISAELRLLIEVIARACKAISHAVGKGALADVLGGAGTDNVQGEAQKKLDVISNEVLLEANEWGGSLRGDGLRGDGASVPDPERIPAGRIPAAVRSARRLVEHRRQRLDRHHLLGAALPEGTTELSDELFLQPGSEQVAAGFAVYGPTTMLVLTVGDGTVGFTLDRELGSFVLTDPQIEVPADTEEFAINMSNMRNWDAPVKRYIDECLAGKDGPRGKDFNMRWVASMVADVYRILSRGGIFMYPRDAKHKDGRLRLMYEANPMAFIVEQAGGAATDGTTRILDIQPTALHQRVGVILGSKNEVERVTSYHRAA